MGGLYIWDEFNYFSFRICEAYVSNTKHTTLTADRDTKHE